MAYRIFISSVQREFAKERKSLAWLGGIRNCEMEGVAACRMTIRI
jgi:hypothetical protein